MGFFNCFRMCLIPSVSWAKRSSRGRLLLVLLQAVIWSTPVSFWGSKPGWGGVGWRAAGSLMGWPGFFTLGSQGVFWAGVPVGLEHPRVL